MLQNLYQSEGENFYHMPLPFRPPCRQYSFITSLRESIGNLFEHRQTEAYNINYGVRNFEIGFPNMYSGKSLSIWISAVRNISHLSAKCGTMNKQVLAFFMHSLCSQSYHNSKRIDD